MNKRLLLLVCLVSLPAAAHDYWLQPDRFQLPRGAALVVHLYLGEELKPQEEKTYEAERTERFELRYGSEVRDLMPVTPEKSQPLYSDIPGFQGPYLFSLVRSAAQVEMTGEDFNEYLAEEGITQFHSTRPRERERYWRFIKLLGSAGSGTETDLHHRFTGTQFEILLLQNPFTFKAGDEQIVQLLFETKPLAQNYVFALHRGSDATLTRLAAITDARGVARFALQEPGMWLIRSVHLRPCQGCKDADWESFWAAYSFEIR